MIDRFQPRDPVAEAAAARKLSIQKITAVFGRRTYKSETALLLAIGEACPFGTWRDKSIWLEEFYRIATERGYYVEKRIAA